MKQISQIFLEGENPTLGEIKFLRTLERKMTVYQAREEETCSRYLPAQS